MNRTRFEWKLRGASLQLGERTLVMGILNVTPDSFSDGGRYSDPDRAFSRALQIEEEGADLIDIGAESTRPGSQRLSEGEEIRRLIPVLKRLAGKLSIPISVDTYKPEVADRALELGAAIINDPSGLTFEPELAKVALKHDAGFVLNHMRGTPDAWEKQPPLPDPMQVVMRELDASLGRARHSGMEKGRIVLDPGLGFGKRKEQNWELIARLDELAELGFPILVGSSRKSFLARPDAAQTAVASAAAVTAAVLNGAHIVRVHDVVEGRIAAQVGDAVLAAHRILPEPSQTPARPPVRVPPRFPRRPEHH